jgi:hypothetical protein
MKLQNIFFVVVALTLTAFSTSSLPAQKLNRLTGTYRLNPNLSDSPVAVADRVSRNLPPGRQERFRNAVLRRLEAPESLVFDVQGRMVTMASSHSNLVTIDADGRANTEMSRNGRSQRTTATLFGPKLVVSTSGDRSIDYQVTFEVINNGRSLRVTRSITDEELARPVVARSVYDRTRDVAQWDLRYDSYSSDSGSGPGNWIIPVGTMLSATLNDNLNSKQIREGDRFTLTVSSPAAYRGAAIEGHVVQVNRAGKVAGRSEMALDFDRVQLRDGRTGNFSGYIESVRTANGEYVNVDNEGRLQTENSQTERTVTRTGIGAAIGAVIGAIAEGGKGAAIGAAVGAGAGAGSVFVQGRDDLDLTGGTEFRLRSANT